MRYLGSVRNTSHDGLFLIMCDAGARFGGWDAHGDELADQGSGPLVLDGLRAHVEEAHGSGRYEVHQSADGTLWITPPAEPGVRPIAPELLECAPRTGLTPMGFVDVPSGELVLALAYPPLGTTTSGDHADITHGAGERLDIVVGPAVAVLTRERAADGQVIAVRFRSPDDPATSP